MNKTVLTSALGLWMSVSAILSPFAAAGTPTSIEAGTTKTSMSTSSGANRSSDWLTERWTGNDQPFAEARAIIDRQFAEKNGPSAIVDSYAREAAAKPTDPLSQFRWAYSGFRLMELPHGGPENGVLFAKLTAAMAAAVQPHTYNYDRLRLLLNPFLDNERALAERVLSRDGNDVYAETAYAQVLVYARPTNGSDVLKGIGIEEQIASAGSDSPRAYSLLGQLYGVCGEFAKSPDYYKRAIAANNKFLSLAPNYDWRRDVALHANEVYKRRLVGN